jgi:hypothetical protein
MDGWTYCSRPVLSNKKGKQGRNHNNGDLLSLKVWLKGIYMYFLTFLNIKTGQWAVYAISLLTVLLIIVVLPATFSWASWLGIIAASAFLAWQLHAFQQKKTRLFARYPKWIIYVILTCLLTAGLMGIYLLKKDSASGRLLIWKITLAANPRLKVGGVPLESLSYHLSGDQRHGWEKDKTRKKLKLKKSYIQNYSIKVFNMLKIFIGSKQRNS